MARKRKDRVLTEKGYPRNLGYKPDQWPEGYQEAGYALWHIGKSYKFIQPKFYLGFDSDKADVAELRLVQLWKQIEAAWEAMPDEVIEIRGPHLDQGEIRLHVSRKAPRPIWEPLTYEIAKAIAKGATTFKVPKLTDQESLKYVEYLAKLRQQYPVITLIAEEPETYQAGADQAQQAADVFRQAARKLDRLTGNGQTLHQALGDYIKELEALDTPWGRTQANQAGRLKEHAKDCPLSRIDLTEMQRMFDPWRKRQIISKLTDKPITRNTASNHVWQLKDFFDELHKNDKYDWRRPPDCWMDLDLTVKDLPEDSAKRNQTLQVETYSVDELAVLYRYASPLMRTMILLALNCGFKQAEIGTLANEGEVFLAEEHTYAAKLGFISTKADSFIKRIRRKSGVYGEFWLWPETVQALKWVKERRQNIKTESPYLLLTSQGKGYADETKGKKKPSRIRNLWVNLFDTIKAEPEHEGFRYLAFSDLRKVAGDMVRDQSNGEISGVFLCHGKPVKTDQLSDIYTNRPFGKVFEAMKLVRQKLAPMFASDMAVKKVASTVGK